MNFFLLALMILVPIVVGVGIYNLRKDTRSVKQIKKDQSNNSTLNQNPNSSKVQPHTQSENNNQTPPKDPLERFPILKFYKKWDYVRVIESFEDKRDPKNALVKWTFLGLADDDKHAVVYNGKVEDEETLNKNTHNIQKIPIWTRSAQVTALMDDTFKNVRAKVRKEKKEGAEAYCEIKDSDTDKRRRKEFIKETELSKLEAPGNCDMTERVTQQLRHEDEKLLNPPEDNNKSSVDSEKNGQEKRQENEEEIEEQINRSDSLKSYHSTQYKDNLETLVSMVEHIRLDEESGRLIPDFSESDFCDRVKGRMINSREAEIVSDLYINTIKKNIRNADTWEEFVALCKIDYRDQNNQDTDENKLKKKVR